MREKIGKSIKIMGILFISMVLIFILMNHTYANGTIDPAQYHPGLSGSATGSDKIKDMANVIIGAIQIVGTVLSVAVLAILGIKYMMGSVEEKAEYKKTLIPYVIGAIMVFGITNILAIVVGIAGKIQTLI